MAERYIDKRLRKMAKDGGKFIKLDVGDSFIGTNVSWKKVFDDKYEKDKVVTMFRMEDGTMKEFSTSSVRVIGKLQYILPNSLLQVTKLGEGPKTDYKFKVLKDGRMPTDTDDDEDEEEEDEAPKKKKKKHAVEEDEDEDEEEDEKPKKKKKKVKIEDLDDDEDEEEDDLFTK